MKYMSVTALMLSFSLLFANCSGGDIDCCVLPNPFTSYFTGDAEDSDAAPTFGITMMGGRSEHDNAMRWFLQRANGGDVLVLRASGSDGYNNYLFSELGVTVNSVETLVIDNSEAANHEYVLTQIANAEAIWMAGGDQNNYISIWGNSPMKGLLNDHVNVKKRVIGGTSAGMAVLGEWVYSASNGSIVSEEALANPFDTRLTLTKDFLNISLLSNLITDTHYSERGRQGRHSAFMARMAKSTGQTVFGIACDEYSAVCVGADGQAVVYGNSPQTNEAAYFIQARCNGSSTPETCESGQPLTWNLDGKALHVYKVAGDNTGTRTFDMNTWRSGNGGEWLNWYVENGVWHEVAGVAPDCD